MSRKTIIYIGLVLIVTVLVSVSYFSYAFFTNRSEQRGKLNIVAGTIDYKFEIVGETGHYVDVPAHGLVRVFLKVTSLNDFETAYVTSYYPEVQDITVYYDRYEGVDETRGILPANGTITFPVIIENPSNSDSWVELFVDGGFADRNLNTIAYSGYDMVSEGWQGWSLAENIFHEFRNIYTIANDEEGRSILSDSGQTTELYKSYETDSGEPTYFFRGYTNANFVEYAGYTWRIIRINEDGTYRLILDEYIEENANQGIVYAYNESKYSFDFDGSNVQLELENWYNANIGSKPQYSNLIATPNHYFCDDSGVTESTAYNEDREVESLVPAAQYFPTFKCTSNLRTGNRVNSNVGLITYDEAIYAGYDAGWETSSYHDSYLSGGRDFFTMTPAGMTSGNYYTYIWVAQNNCTMFPVVTSSGRGVRPVINLKADVYAYQKSNGHYVIY